MRALIALTIAALALAGCTAPEEERPNPLFGVCPQWIHGDLVETFQVTLDGEETVIAWPAEDADLEPHQGFPLDQYTVHITNVSLDDDVELRAHAHEADKRLAFTQYDGGAASRTPFLSLADGDEMEVDVFLTAVAHGTEPAPDALRLTWSGPGTGSMMVELRASYRVCGAPV